MHHAHALLSRAGSEDSSVASSTSNRDVFVMHDVSYVTATYVTATCLLAMQNNIDNNNSNSRLVVVVVVV